VSAEQAMAADPQTQSAADRLAAGLLLCGMALGSLALWIAVPLGCLWLSSRVAGTSAEEYLLALPLTIVAMVLFGLMLGWLNRLYLRLTGVLARYEAELEEYGVEPSFLRGPLEPLLVGSLVIALVAMVVWFFLLAKDPPLVPL
jgi:hypothetical protein